jgi:hypothetical protein
MIFRVLACRARRPALQGGLPYLSRGRTEVRRFLPLSLIIAAFLVVAAAGPAAAVELNLAAEIAKGAKQPVTKPVEWSVTRLFDDKKPGEVVASSREPAPKFSLEPGRYLVSSKMGLDKAEQTV